MANHAFITLEKFPDDGSSWHVAIRARNGEFSGVQDFYTQPGDLDTLGAAFCRFPQHIRDEVQFQLGDQTGKWAYCVLIRAFLYDSVGHAAIEFAVDNNAKSPPRAHTNFFICTEVAAINRLGQQLQSWMVNHEAPLIWMP